MTAVRVAGRVGVVLEEVDLAPDPFLLQALFGRVNERLENPLAGLVVGDDDP